MDPEEITLEDLPKVLEYIYGCMIAYKKWNAKYQIILKEYKEGIKKIDQQTYNSLQKNYTDVMNALIVCFDFIEKCDHILYDQKSNLLFGIIYVSMDKVETDNPILLDKIEKYKRWFETRN